MKVSFYDIICIAPIDKLKTAIDRKVMALIIKNEDELRTYGGKEGFLSVVRKKIPDINEIDLSEDYWYLSKLLRSIKYNFLHYDRYLGTKHLYPNLKFIYSESLNENNGDNLTGVKFKKLDKMILPINHPIWRKIYPPNHINDNCSIENSDEQPKKRIFVFGTPKPSKEFNIDYIGLYEKHKNILKPDDPYIRTKPVEIVDLTNDVNGVDNLFIKSLNDVYKEYYSNLTDKEINEQIQKNKL